MSHADVDEEYVIAATIWPWTLPPEWEDATQRLLDARVLSDRRFIEDSITPLRQS